MYYGDDNRNNKTDREDEFFLMAKEDTRPGFDYGKDAEPVERRSFKRKITWLLTKVATVTGIKNIIMRFW